MAGSPARGWHFIVGQAPARIERRTETTDGLSGQHRLVAKLGTDGVDRFRAFDGIPRIDGVREEALAIPCVPRREVTAFAPRDHVRVRLDDDGPARILYPCGLQHSPERRGVGTRSPDRGIANGLVDDENVPGVRVALRYRNIVLRQTVSAQQGNSLGRASVLIGLGASEFQQLLQPRGAGRIVINPDIVDHQRHGRNAPVAGIDRPQEAVLDRDERLPRKTRYETPARRRGLAPPNAHGAARGQHRQPQPDPPARRSQDLRQARLGEEPRRIDVEARVPIGSGSRAVQGQADQSPASVLVEAAKFTIGETAPRIFSQRTNGAVVT